MSLFDVPEGEMGSDPDHVDRELERLLSSPHPGDDGSADLRDLLGDLAVAFPSRTLDAEGQHLAAMVGAAHLLADNGDPVGRPVSNADAPAQQVSRLPKHRRNDVNVKKTILTKVVAPLAAALTLMGGMAFAGVLPEPLQSDVDTVLGRDDGSGDDLDLSDETVDDDASDDEDNANADDLREGDVLGDDQGEVDDDQGAAGDDQGTAEGDDADADDGTVGGGDDQGDDADDQGDDADDQGDDADDQGDDAGDQGDDADDDDDQGDDADDQGDDADDDDSQNDADDDDEDGGDQQD